MLYTKKKIAIIILVITFMQVIYIYIPETNNVSRVYSITYSNGACILIKKINKKKDIYTVAPVLYLRFVLQCNFCSLQKMFCTCTLAHIIIFKCLFFVQCLFYLCYDVLTVLSRG